MEEHFSAKANINGSGRTAYQSLLPTIGSYVDKENYRLMIKGHVPRSMRLETYEAFVCFQLDEDLKTVSSIHEAFCPCLASELQDCQHIACLVFTAQRNVDMCNTTCTDKPCYWKAPGVLTGDARKDLQLPVSEMAIYKHTSTDIFKTVPLTGRRCARRSDIYKRELSLVRKLPPDVVLMIHRNRKLAIEVGRKRMKEETEAKKKAKEIRQKSKTCIYT